MRRPITLACALLSALLIFAGCGTYRGIRKPVMTPPATSTPVTLTWRAVPMPAGVSLQSNTYLTAAPSPAHVVWACAATDRQHFSIWALRAADGAWKQTGALTVDAPSVTGRCVPIADHTDPHTMVVVYPRGDGSETNRSFISTDDGAHWRQVGDQVSITDVAEIGGKTLALLYDESAQHSTQGLVISSDHLRTWSPVAMPLADASDISRFWINPAGEVLAVTRGDHLWRGKSQGLTWERVADYTSDVGFVAWLPVAKVWRICFIVAGLSDEVRCTDDLGKSWEEPPRLNRPIGCGQCNHGAQPTVCLPNLMAPDGSTLAYCLDDKFSSPNQSTLLRLPLNGLTWQNLGPAPAWPLAVWDDGTLWSLEGQAGTFHVTMLPA